MQETDTQQQALEIANLKRELDHAKQEHKLALQLHHATSEQMKKVQWELELQLQRQQMEIQDQSVKIASLTQQVEKLLIEKEVAFRLSPLAPARTPPHASIAAVSNMMSMPTTPTQIPTTTTTNSNIPASPTIVPMMPSPIASPLQFTTEDSNKSIAMPMTTMQQQQHLIDVPKSRNRKKHSLSQEQIQDLNEDLQIDDSSVRIVSGGPVHVKLWNTDKCERELRGHFKYVWTLCAHAGDLYSGSADKSVRVWSIDTNECKRIIRHPKEVNCLASHNSYLASGCEDKVLRLWSTPNGSLVKELKGHNKGIQSMCSNGELIFSGSGDSDVRVWDADQGKCLQVLKGHNSTVFCVAWEPYTQVLYSSSWDKTIKMWDLRVGDQAMRTMEGHTHCVNAITSHAGMICSGSWDETIKLWDLQTGTCMQTLQGHDAYISSLCSYGKYLVSGSADQTIKYWNVEQMQCVKTVLAGEGLAESVYSVCTVQLQ